MNLLTGNVFCPQCGERCPTSSLEDYQLPPWQAALADSIAEVECPTCGWEFGVEADGETVDDGDADKEAPFEVDADGELTTETCHEVRCPGCRLVFDVDDPDRAVCPGCRRPWAEGEYDNQALPAAWSFEEERWDWDPEDEEESQDGFVCPYCGDRGDYDSPEFTPLDRDWILCNSCGATLHDAEEYTELVRQWRRDQWNPKEYPQRARFVVAADGSGDFLEVNQAIQASGRCAILTIKPGVYETDIRTDGRRLTLIGEGPPEGIRLQGSLQCIGGRVRLRGLTLSNSVDALQTRLSLVDCTLAGAGDVGLRAIGKLTTVRLRRCTIQDCEDAGICARAAADVRLVDCRLQRNLCGVLVGEGSWARLRRCQVADNWGDGVYVEPGNTAFLHECRLVGNGQAGLWLSGGRAVLTACEISGQADAGIHVGRRGTLVLRRCAIRGGGSAGVRLDSWGRLYLRDCTVADNQGHGLILGHKTRVLARNCRLAGQHHLEADARLRTLGSEPIS